MYELFFNFLIEELLVRYFKKINVEPGDKFYIVIEDFALRRDFYKALHNSVFTHNHKICFPGYENMALGHLNMILWHLLVQIMERRFS